MRLHVSSVLLFCTLVASSAALTACRGTGNSATAAPAPHQYPIRGIVVSIDQAAGKVTLKHEAVTGLMPAMTMPYRLADPSALTELHPGDLITGALTGSGEDLRIKDIDIIGQARPDYKPAVQYHVPAPGDVVPDFTLLNQSNRTLSLKQFRGKLVAMTFIYTRCPLSDFCPRMSRNFAEIDKALQSNPALYRDTHLLSVSFDPTYDTPKVLKSYGAAYTGRFANETFQHWDFAAPPIAELPKMEQYFDVGVTPGQSGILQHSLSTVIIGKDGKVIAFYPTNDWTPAEVLAKINSAIK